MELYHCFIVAAKPLQLPTPSESIENAATNVMPVTSEHVQVAPAQGDKAELWKSTT